MNKNDLIRAVAESTSDSKATVARVLDAILGAIPAVVAAGEKVSLVGFGTFEVRKRAKRDGRNPQTGEAMVIPESIVPGFKAGKDFKDRVKQG